MITPESQLEEALVTTLRDLKYVYRFDIRDRATLEANFREKFETLNRVTLTDGEFQRLLDEIVTPDVYEAARTLRNREAFIRDDGTPLNYTLVNIKDWCKNNFEVVNQLRINTDNSHHRYDVILLINGVPVVQIELKTLGISPRRAMEQIVYYKNDPGNGYTKTLLCFLQLFIVSNRTDTWYFANNNARHFAFDADERFLPIYQFAAENNTKITHLDDFADRFLAKCTLGQMISKYMVLIASEQKLLMMRPYQIYAVKAIVDCIDQNCGNGYVWHTTGSGKTLTSFKASTLLKTNESIHKCLFVVDRKDLDRQTREEFNRFQENCVEENTNTAALVRRLQSDDYADKVIVTTIQKLGLALDENSKHNKQNIADGRSTFKQRLEQLRDKRMVFIFDECHRSQFGENHKAIKEFFPNAQLFGFTGTPIFEENATVKQIEGNVATLRTTKDLFQKELHAYTITHAIEDRNVLRFHVDYYKPKDASALKPGQTLTKQAVAQAILDKHDAATGGRRFNALLATASINDAIEYYEVFKKLRAEGQRLKEQQGTPGKDGEPAHAEVDQLDFEFVLFASAVIDYDYIMKLIAKYSGQDPKRLTISREQLIGLIQSDAKFLNEREEITEYVRSLKEGEGLDEAAIRAGYEQFKAAKQDKEIEGLAQVHGLTTESFAAFVDTILQRMIFDGEQLTDLMEPLGLGWRERRERELALMADLVPLLNKRANGRDISGLNAYEHGGAR